MHLYNWDETANRILLGNFSEGDKLLQRKVTEALRYAA
jgi:hypothetical protein